MKARLILSVMALIYSILYTINPSFFMKRIENRMYNKDEKRRQRVIDAQKKANAKAGLENPPDEEIMAPIEREPLNVPVRVARIMGMVMIVVCVVLCAYCGYQLYIAG